jgi:hypothetical protein
LLVNTSRSSSFTVHDHSVAGSVPPLLPAWLMVCCRFSTAMLPWRAAPELASTL